MRFSYPTVVGGVGVNCRTAGNKRRRGGGGNGGNGAVGKPTNRRRVGGNLPGSVVRTA